MSVAPGLDTSDVDFAKAKATYFAFVRTADAASLDPHQNWDPEIRRWAIDPAATDALREIGELANDSSRIVGHASFTATVTGVHGSELQLRVCVDNSGQDIIDKSTGRSVKDEIGGKHPQDATLVSDELGNWMVQSIRGFPEKSC